MLYPCRDRHGYWSSDLRGLPGGRRSQEWAEPKHGTDFLSPDHLQARNLGARGLPAHTLWDLTPQGTQEESALPLPSPTLPCRPVCMPGQGWSFARTLLLILQAPRTKVQSQVVMGFTYLRGGLGTQAMGYAMKHYLQSQKSRTDHSSIDRRLGEGTLAQPPTTQVSLAQPPTTQVSAEEGWRVVSKH